MREFYASDDFKLNSQEHSFFSVLFKYNNDDVPIDTLLIGSRDSKYNVRQWNEKIDYLDQKWVLPPVAFDSSAKPRPAKVLVVHWYGAARPTISLFDVKKDLGYTDDDLEIVFSLDTNLDFILGDAILSKMPMINGKVAVDQPIHYMNLEGTNGLDVNILRGLSPDLLKKVRYLNFEMNKVGSWARANFSSLIDYLKEAGLVCYWSGKRETDNGLWRITDCFLDYYQAVHWARISCVNRLHDDVGQLADRMETKFEETLSKSQAFPAK